jgi:hypothetical protein
MSTVTTIRDAIWRAWQQAAKAHRITPPDKIWAERAAFAVIDFLPEPKGPSAQ